MCAKNPVGRTNILLHNMVYHARTRFAHKRFVQFFLFRAQTFKGHIINHGENRHTSGSRKVGYRIRRLRIFSCNMIRQFQCFCQISFIPIYLIHRNQFLHTPTNSLHFITQMKAHDLCSLNRSRTDRNRFAFHFIGSDFLTKGFLCFTAQKFQQFLLIGSRSLCHKRLPVNHRMNNGNHP